MLRLSVYFVFPPHRDNRHQRPQDPTLSPTEDVEDPAHDDEEEQCCHHADHDDDDRVIARLFAIAPFQIILTTHYELQGSFLIELTALSPLFKLMPPPLSSEAAQ